MPFLGACFCWKEAYLYTVCHDDVLQLECKHDDADSASFIDGIDGDW